MSNYKLKPVRIKRNRARRKDRWHRFKIGKTFINYLKTMKQGEHEIDNSISNIIK